MQALLADARVQIDIEDNVSSVLMSCVWLLTTDVGCVGVQYGKTALDYAKEMRRADIIVLLEKRGSGCQQG